MFRHGSWLTVTLLAGCHALLPLLPPSRDSAAQDAPASEAAASQLDLGPDASFDLPPGPDASFDLPPGPDAARDAAFRDSAAPDQGTAVDQKPAPDKKALTKEAGVIKTDKGPILCTASTCPSGCCDTASGTCVTSGASNSLACGVAGAACTDCSASGLYCSNGQCTAPPCGPCTGCCAPPNKCLTYDKQTAAQCGSFGVMCKTCASNYCCGGICSFVPCP